MKNLKTFEEILFEPTHIKRFSEFALTKREIKDKFGDIIKQLQELVLHLFDKNTTSKIKCKITSKYDKDNDTWVDGIELPNNEFSKLNLKDLSELLKQKKKLLPCVIKLIDKDGSKIKEPTINNYLVFYHPKTDKQEPSMPWEKKKV
jgi:hypothetical protein